MSDTPEDTPSEENNDIENTQVDENIDEAEIIEEDSQAEEASAAESSDALAEENASEPEAALEAESVVEPRDEPRDEPRAEPRVETPRKTTSASNLVNDSDVNIETILKVPVSVAIEVGRTKMILSDLLETQEGTVIELERLLEEPLDILVNGALIAHGVVVLADDRFGIQITDIISQQERAQSL